MPAILEAIADAIPHWESCMARYGEERRCNCGAVGKRNVLYVRVQAYVTQLTAGRVYIDRD